MTRIELQEDERNLLIYLVNQELSTAISADRQLRPDSNDLSIEVTKTFYGTRIAQCERILLELRK